MKKALIFTLAALSVACAPEPKKELTAEEKEMLTIPCEQVQLMAQNVMGLRNMRFRIQAAQKVKGGMDTPALNKFIAADAYSRPPVLDEVEAAGVETEYGSQWYLKCENLKAKALK